MANPQPQQSKSSKQSKQDKVKKYYRTNDELLYVMEYYEKEYLVENCRTGETIWLSPDELKELVVREVKPINV